MAVIDPADARSDVGDVSHSRRWKLLVTALAILMAIGVAVGIWQWRSVDAFGGQGNLIPWNDLKVGSTVLMTAGEPGQDIDPSFLTVHSAEPQVTEGNLPVEVLVCHRWPGSVGIGSVWADQIDKYCETFEPAEGARMDAGDQLIYRVGSDEPGSIVIEGVKVTYSHGWRRGSEITGPTVEVGFVAGMVREEVPAG
jgi:hypothetical protein